MTVEYARGVVTVSRVPVKESSLQVAIAIDCPRITEATRYKLSSGKDAYYGGRNASLDKTRWL
jgi:hypothetical protein